MLPGDRAALRPLEIDLGDLVVLEHRDALLADVDRDDQLALRGRQRRPARRLAAAAGAPSERRRSCRCDIVLRSPACARRTSLPSPVGPGCGGRRCGVRGGRCQPCPQQRVAAAPLVPGFLRPALRDYRGGAWAIRIGCGVRGRAVGGGRSGLRVDRVESLRLERQQAVKPLRRRIHSSVDGTRASENSFMERAARRQSHVP